MNPGSTRQLIQKKSCDRLPSVKAVFCNIPNAGDQFNHDLFRRYGYSLEESAPEFAEVTAVGSVLQFLPADYTGAVLGAGFILEEARNNFNQGVVYAVRGRLSESRVRRSKLVLGDPGLLAARIYPRSTTQYDLGIVPHYVDADHLHFARLSKREPKRVLVIDVTQSPGEVFAQISKCACIASSSLHGLVFADALEIPSVWLVASEKVIGGGFKFRDYFSVFRESPQPLVVSEGLSLSTIVKATTERSSVLPDIKFSLNQLFSGLTDIIAEVQERRRSPMRRVRLRVCNRLLQAKSVVFGEHAKKYSAELH